MHLFEDNLFSFTSKNLTVNSFFDEPLQGFDASSDLNKTSFIDYASYQAQSDSIPRSKRLRPIAPAMTRFFDSPPSPTKLNDISSPDNRSPRTLLCDQLTTILKSNTVPESKNLDSMMVKSSRDGKLVGGYLPSQYKDIQIRGFSDLSITRVGKHNEEEKRQDTESKKNLRFSIHQRLRQKLQHRILNHQSPQPTPVPSSGSSVSGTSRKRSTTDSPKYTENYAGSHEEFVDFSQTFQSPFSDQSGGLEIVECPMTTSFNQHIKSYSKDQLLPLLDADEEYIDINTQFDEFFAESIYTSLNPPEGLERNGSMDSFFEFFPDLKASNKSIDFFGLPETQFLVL